MEKLTVSGFEQGGFYVNNGAEYSSSSEIRSGWITFDNTAVTVECGILQWSFICRDSDGVFHEISESSGYKSSGETVVLTAYPWISEIRIELSGSNLSPPRSCVLYKGYAWKMDANFPIPAFAVELPLSSMSSPYPDSLWRIESQKFGGIPFTNLFIAPPQSVMSKPYPDSLWRIDANINNGLPYTNLMPVELPNGAFKDVAELAETYIPESVKKIGSYSFSGTALTSVKIAPDCEYSETSFPPDCVVEFYGTGGYGQLYDSDGFALLDSEGVRIYSRSETNG